MVGEPTRWGLLEIALQGPDVGNPFVDVELSAEFRCGDRSWTVGGFYDGEGSIDCARWPRRKAPGSS